MKIIQINGFRGMMMAAFIAAGLISGFVACPGIISMRLWNYFLVPYGFPVLDAFQGVLLWAIIVLSYYILTKGYMPVSFASPDKVMDEELELIMQRAKMRSQLRKMNAKVMTMDKFEKEILNKKIENDIEKALNNNDGDSDDKIANIK